jgi:hypothetical protein
MSEREGGWLVPDTDEECTKCRAWMGTYGVQCFFCRADENRTVAQIKECFDKTQTARERVNRIPFTEEDFADG